MDWFRFYSSTIHDQKLKRIAREMSVRVPEALGRWAILLSLASDSPQRGKLLLAETQPIRIEDLADAFDTTEADAALWMDQFKAKAMVSVRGSCWVIVNWDKRQFASDDVTQRVRKHRTRNVPETFPKRFNSVSCNVSETGQSTETDAEGKGDGAKAPIAGSILAHPLGKLYVDLFIPGGIIPSKQRRRAYQAILELEQHPAYTHELACNALRHWHDSHENNGQTKPLQYIAPAIADLLTEFQEAQGSDD